MNPEKTVRIKEIALKKESKVDIRKTLLGIKVDESRKVDYKSILFESARTCAKKLAKEGRKFSFSNYPDRGYYIVTRIE